MKIRTDFVTNSSSSSFVVSLRILTKAGQYIDWESYVYTEDGEIIVKKSAKELAECGTIDELLQTLKESVYTIEPRVALFKSNSRFVKMIEQLNGMNDIRTIMVDGQEKYREGYIYYRKSEYDLENGHYEILLKGGCHVSEGAGGSIVVNDYREATVSSLSDTYSGLTIKLTAKNGSWTRYDVVSYRDVNQYTGLENSIRIYRNVAEFEKCSSFDELVALANRMVYVNEKPIGLGEKLVAKNESIRGLNDLDKLEVTIHDQVAGDQVLDDRHQSTGISGTTFYIFDFNTKNETISTSGFTFSHGKGAAVEIINDKLGELSDGDFSTIGRYTSSLH